MVDNTFAPMIFIPSRLGADVVVYSMTKYINGVGDLIAGAICADKDFILELMDLHTGRVMLLGPTMDPRVAFDILQRISPTCRSACASTVPGPLRRPRC